ncbi:MAG TPA: glutathione ABC transporter ATP-binding protein, partial [Actinotalea sp.]|nr:glutathione ABC transporter ATP-binding protein [Actinotalea sp.]
ELLSDRIAAMHHGKLVEVDETSRVVNDPQDPYTQRLIAAVPVPDPEEQRKRREARDQMLEAQRLEIEREEAEAARASGRGHTAEATDLEAKDSNRGF